MRKTLVSKERVALGVVQEQSSCQRSRGQRPQASLGMTIGHSGAKWLATLRNLPIIQHILHRRMNKVMDENMRTFGKHISHTSSYEPPDISRLDDSGLAMGRLL